MNLDPGGGNDLLVRNHGGLPSQDVANQIATGNPAPDLFQLPGNFRQLDPQQQVSLLTQEHPADESAGWLGDLAMALGIAGATAGVGSGLGLFGAAGGAGAGADAGAAAAADAGATGLTDVGVGAATSGLGTLSAADTAGLTAGLADAGVSAGAAGGLAADAMPEVTVTGTAPAAGLGGGALPGMMLGAGMGLNALNINGGSVGPSANPAGTSDNSSSFLPATGASDVSGLSSDLASSLGIDTGGGMPSVSGGLSGFPSDITSFSPDLSSVGTDAATSMPDTGLGTDWGSWLSNPKNLGRLGMLGISGINALSKPKLPGAAQTALNAAGPAVQQASSIIQSGGTATPMWAQQKASIDQSIDQQIQQQTESILQAAANSGMGDKNSGVVQQQIAQMQQNANVQRQQLYSQAQQQNVNNAVSELTGGNQTLSAIAQMQLAEEQQARQTAAQTAQLAMQLSQLSWPGG